MTTTSTIAEQVADYHRASAGQLPAEVADAFAAEQRALAAAGEPVGVAQPGTPLPLSLPLPPGRPGDERDLAGDPPSDFQSHWR